MFSKLVLSNSQRDRKHNMLYFVSMVVSIIALYNILTLPKQDVMIFFTRLDGDATNVFKFILPIFFVFSLFVLLFLVFYSSGIYLEKRKHEFGLYLTLGMSKKRLFLLLLLEDLYNNLKILILAIPLSILVSELVSLFSAKLFGVGFLGHHFTISIESIVLSILGFIAVKLVSFLFLATKIVKRQIGELLYNTSQNKKTYPKIIYILSLVVGLVLLAYAYYRGFKDVFKTRENVIIVVVCGTLGTILFFYGLRLVLDIITKIKTKNKLYTFNVRQIQEVVINNSISLAFVSLIIFVSLSIFGVISTFSFIVKNDIDTNIHYTFENKIDSKVMNLDSIKTKLDSVDVLSKFENIYEFRRSKILSEDQINLNNFKKMVKIENKDTLSAFLHNTDFIRLIPLSSYNDLRVNYGKKPLTIDQHSAYLHIAQYHVKNPNNINEVLTKHPTVKVLNQEFSLIGEFQSHILGINKNINIGLVVSDEQFLKLTNNQYESFVNAYFHKDYVAKNGLFQSLFRTNEVIDKTNLIYQSPLSGLARQSLMTVALTYISIYIALIFLVVANTVISTQFLLAQSQSIKRYQTLYNLGANHKLLYKSITKQINHYFSLPIIMALINTAFAIKSVFIDIEKKGLSYLQTSNVVLTIAQMFILLFIFEIIYIFVVKRSSKIYLLNVLSSKRER